MRAPVLSTLALGALLVVLGACTTGGGVASSAAPSAPAATAVASQAPGAVTTADLNGRTFVSTNADGHSLVPSSAIRLTFAGMHLGTSAGCNQMSGEYGIIDRLLQVGMLAMTEMACQEPLMAQDTWLAAFLPGAATTLDGDTLTLAKDGVTITFLDDEVANPDQALEGTRWVLDGIVSGDAVSSVPIGATASLTFKSGSVTVEAGCNSGSGSYTLGEGTITFGPLVMTRRPCEAGVMGLETAMTQVLTGEATYAIDGGALTLMNGANGLVFKAAS